MTGFKAAEKLCLEKPKKKKEKKKKCTLESGSLSEEPRPLKLSHLHTYPFSELAL